MSDDPFSRPDTFFIGLNFVSKSSTFKLFLVENPPLVEQGIRTIAEVFRNLASSFIFSASNLLVVEKAKAEVFRNFPGLRAELTDKKLPELRLSSTGLVARLFHSPIRSDVLPRDTLCRDIVFFSTLSSCDH